MTIKVHVCDQKSKNYDQVEQEVTVGFSGLIVNWKP